MKVSWIIGFLVFLCIFIFSCFAFSFNNFIITAIYFKSVKSSGKSCIFSVVGLKNFSKDMLYISEYNTKQYNGWIGWSIQRCTGIANKTLESATFRKKYWPENSLICLGFPLWKKIRVNGLGSVLLFSSYINNHVQICLYYTVFDHLL